MKNLYWLEQIQSSECTLVGDEAFQLSTLVQSGYPVLPGFVVSAQVLWEFLRTLNVIEPLVADLPHSSLHLDVDNPRQLQRVAQRLRQEITTAPLPDEWVQLLLDATQQWEAPAIIFRPSLALGAVPKSGKHGLLEAQACTYQEQAIALGLKQTWSQLFRARSLFFWQRHAIEWQQINLAVLVQPLRNAIASGSLTCNLAEIEIKASWGLEMAVVRGEVLPDYYLINLETGKVRSQHLGNKTLAYGLVNSLHADLTTYHQPPLVESADNCLQMYLLNESQQQNYALNHEELQQLIQLAQQLSRQIKSVFTLEWTLCQLKDTVEPQFYITQINTSCSPHSYAHTDVQAATLTHLTPTSIKGLGAATGTVVASAYVITNSTLKAEIPPGVILVASAIAPDWLPLLQQAVGLITERGGLTSHCAILARELGIPAVVSAANVTQLLQTGASVLLDGDRGEIHLMHTQESELLEAPHIPPVPDSAVKSQYLKFKISTPHTTQIPIATQLLVNLSQSSLISQAKDLPLDGVGLLRSELMILNVLAGQHPQTWLYQGRKAELVNLWQEQIAQFARAFAPQPVFYRSLDWRSHEFQFLSDTSTLSTTNAPTAETNPMLGQRGTFSYVRDPTVFDLELAAVAAVQQAGYTNIHLILPFVRTVEEFSFCRRRVEQASLTQVPQFQLWIMAEVPSVLFLLPQYVAAGVQGVSIGTNDLTQLLLGVDRDSSELAAAFDERHPAVMQVIAQIIQMAKQLRIPCSICGQAPALYPELIDSLVRWGITSISVELDAIEQTYAAIARAEHRLLLESARKQLNIQ